MAVWNDDILFVHIPKTAGMAIRKYVRDNSPPDTATQLSWRDGYPDHAPLRDIPEWTGRPLASWRLIVAVLRNPYEQQLSQWWQWRDSYARGGRSPVEASAVIAADLQTWLLDPLSHYGVWYELALAPGRRDKQVDLTGPTLNETATAVHAKGYYEWWLTVDGAEPANLLVLPFAEVGRRFPQAARPYTTDGAPDELPKTNLSRSRDARQYHTQLSKNLIDQRFAWSVERGYVAPTL